MSKLLQLPLRFLSSARAEPDTGVLPIDGGFPEERANELARSESYNKHLYRPNTYLHKWWARRSGTTFRYILKQLARDSQRRHYYEPGGLEGQTILDPMMGGGTTLHEAIRLGANVVGIDIDPIPVLQARAALALADVSHRKRVYRDFYQALSARLRPLYLAICPACGRESQTQFVLYGLRRKCKCREVLFLDSLTIREDSPEDVFICPHCWSVTRGRQHECLKLQDRQIVTKGTNVCDQCQGAFEDILDLPFYERYHPLVLMGSCSEHGQFCSSVTQRDLNLLAEAREEADRVRFADTHDFRVCAVRGHTRFPCAIRPQIGRLASSGRGDIR